MYSESFDYYRPQTLDEAIQVLRDHDNVKIIAGGHSLLPAMKLRVAQPSALVDLSRIAGLSGIEVGGGSLKIGAMTTHTMIADSDVVWRECPLLAETAAQIGDQQVRNRGTIGGSLAHADPAADLPTIMLTLGATFTATGSGGSRTFDAASFYQGLFTTALAPDEILTSINVPITSGAGKAGAYLKHRHPASSYAVVGVAVQLDVQNGQIASASVAVGGASPNPVRASAAEQALIGQVPSADTFFAASDRVAEAITDPMGDIYASAEYRVHLATVMTRRALALAADRAAQM